MRIGFLCFFDPFDRHSFSGTVYYAYHALSEAAARGEITELRRLVEHPPRRRIDRLLDAVKRRLGRRPKGPIPPTVTDMGEGLDYIISLMSAGLTLKLAPGLGAPFVTVTDSTPGFLREFYAGGESLSLERDAEEKALTEQAALAVYSSQFMADRACVEFGDHIAPKLRTIPFGVNLDNLPQAPQHPERMPGGDVPVELLFIGREWERKGGPLLLEALKVLRDGGLDARLTIVGCNPAEAIGAPGVTIHPYLNKNRPHDAAILDGLLDQAHLFLLPTRADCTPMVIAEASAHSLPVIATNVGGIPSILSEGENGIMLPHVAQGEEWAAAIRQLIADPVRYRALRESSFAFYRNRLNWTAWVRDMLAELKALPLPERGMAAIHPVPTSPHEKTPEAPISGWAG